MNKHDLYIHFQHHHDRVARLIQKYVEEHGGCVQCDKTVHLRYMDSSDDNTYTWYKFDHIYIADCGECIVVYTEDTDLGECVIDYLTCDEMSDLIGSIKGDEDAHDDWERYIEYLHEWAEDHSEFAFRGMTPASFEEWCDNERSEE